MKCADTIQVVSSTDNTPRYAHARWGGAEIDTQIFKVDEGPLLYLQPDGLLRETNGRRWYIYRDAPADDA